MRAASVIGEDVMSGRASSWQAMVSVENFHRSAQAPPAFRRHAGHIIPNYDTAGHSLTIRLCRVPGDLTARPRWDRAGDSTLPILLRLRS
jgi:hypothetical protein